MRAEIDAAPSLRKKEKRLLLSLSISLSLCALQKSQEFNSTKQNGYLESATSNTRCCRVQPDWLRWSGLPLVVFPNARSFQKIEFGQKVECRTGIWAWIKHWRIKQCRGCLFKYMFLHLPAIFWVEDQWQVFCRSYAKETHLLQFHFFFLNVAVVKVQEEEERKADNLGTRIRI